VHVTATLKAQTVESVTESLASVTVSQASQAEHVTSVDHDTQLSTVSAHVRVPLFNAI